jgi:hypothetical protein
MCPDPDADATTALLSPDAAGAPITVSASAAMPIATAGVLFIFCSLLLTGRPDDTLSRAARKTMGRMTT